MKILYKFFKLKYLIYHGRYNLESRIHEESCGLSELTRKSELTWILILKKIHK